MIYFNFSLKFPFPFLFRIMYNGYLDQNRITIRPPPPDIFPGTTDFLTDAIGAHHVRYVTTGTGLTCTVSPRPVLPISSNSNESPLDVASSY